MDFSSFDTAGQSIDVIFLHAQEQDGDRDRDQHRPGRKACVPVIDVFLLQHFPQTDRDRVLIRIGAADDLCEDEVNPGSDERGQDRVYNDRPGQRKRDFGEDLPVCAAIDHGSLIDRNGYSVKKALGDLEGKRRSSGITQDECKRDQRSFRQPYSFQDEIDRDHAHESGEEPQDHSHVHT